MISVNCSSKTLEKVQGQAITAAWHHGDHYRPASVVFESLDWKDVVERYDASGTLFYLDSPYFSDENDYGKDTFDRQQSQTMAETLRTIKGKFLLSINDTPEIREWFGGHIDDVRLKYTISQKGADRKAVAGLF